LSPLKYFCQADPNLKGAEKMNRTTAIITELGGLSRLPGARPLKLFGGRMRTLLPAFLVCLLAMVSHAQTAVQTAHAPDGAAPAAPDAQKIFEKMKTLAGLWLGALTTVPRMDGMEGRPAQIILRETSRGHALLHEITVSGLPDDPITMFYLEGDRLLLTHYCDAGNRPRMEGKISADGMTMEFDFIDLAGGERKGHMTHAVFTIIDANHHTEDWTLMLQGDKPVQVHFDLQRAR
jgi:hypothetical protein